MMRGHHFAKQFAQFRITVSACDQVAAKIGLFGQSKHDHAIGSNQKKVLKRTGFGIVFEYGVVNLTNSAVLL